MISPPVGKSDAVLRDDVDDCALTLTAEFSREPAGENFERVDDPRIEDLREIGIRCERKRGAVDLVRDAVEAVRDRLVVRELHDPRHRLDEAIEILILW